ncbi:MAG: class I SAM-dependent methyltransferase [Burkholderiales bacterium]
MRKHIGRLIDTICQARAHRRLSQHYVGGAAMSLDQLALQIEAVPGMMSPEGGALLFLLAATQRARGDIVEIGSWQGRSTIYLAKGAKVSGNGSVFAIDHFLGNPGKEALYRLDGRDLSDLEAGFRRNIHTFGVNELVELLPMPSAEAAVVLAARPVQARLLFIDGNHEYEAVRADYEAFSPSLIQGALVVFDDCSLAFPGVVQFTEELTAAGTIRPLFTYGNTFVGETIDT